MGIKELTQKIERYNFLTTELRLESKKIEDLKHSMKFTIPARIEFTSREDNKRFRYDIDNELSQILIDRALLYYSNRTNTIEQEMKLLEQELELIGMEK